MLMDFQYCFSGVTGDLDDMRKDDGTLMARPYSFNTVEGISSIEGLNNAAATLKNFNSEGNDSARSIVKKLATLSLTGQNAAFDLELDRLIAQRKSAINGEDRDKLKKLAFDVSQVYDLWFREDK